MTEEPKEADGLHTGSETTTSLVLPSIGELLAETSLPTEAEEANRSVDEAAFEEIFERQAVDVERAWTHLRGLEEHYDHKKMWSQFLMWILGGMIGFQWVLLAFVGFSWWDFTRYQWLLPILLVQNLGQIMGLAFVVVKSLFRDMDSQR